MRVDPKPMRLIILPLPLKYIPIRMYQPSPPISRIISPPALILRPIRPRLNPIPLPHVRPLNPLPLVPRPILQLAKGALFKGVAGGRSWACFERAQADLQLLDVLVVIGCFVQLELLSVEFLSSFHSDVGSHGRLDLDQVGLGQDLLTFCI